MVMVEVKDSARCAALLADNEGPRLTPPPHANASFPRADE